MPSGHALATAFLSGLLLGGLLAVTALGLSLVFGVMRLVNIVHGELLVLGAYLSWFLLKDAGIDPLLGTLVVAPALLVIGLPIQRLLLNPIMGTGAEAPLLTTFGLSIIGQNLFLLFWSADTRSLQASYGTASARVLGLDVPVMYAIGFGFALVLTTATQLFIRRTSLGRQIRASAEDPSAAEVLGVDVGRVYTFTYGLGAAFAGIGGILVGLAFSFTPTTGTAYLLTGFAVVVLGGLGSLKGTLLGGLILGVIESVGASFPQVGDGYRDFIGLVTFLVILAIRPRGLFGRGD